MGDLEWGALGGRNEGGVDHELKGREKAFEMFIIQVRQLPNHGPQGVIHPFADGVAPGVVTASH